jgi:hypothetical protein
MKNFDMCQGFIIQVSKNWNVRHIPAPKALGQKGTRLPLRSGGELIRSDPDPV